MKKAVIYASTTGNTEAMANAVAEGVKSCGAEVLMSTASDANVSDVLACDVIILGSPAMGDEVLEDSMEEFYTNLEGGLSGKKSLYSVLMIGATDSGLELGLNVFLLRVRLL